jgi:hypothetical protein
MSLYDNAIESLRAQRALLEADLKLWTRRASKDGDLPLHRSQVIRLNDRISAALSSALEGTPVTGDRQAPFGGTVDELPALRRAVGTVHLLWDFFRDKLAQRDTAAYSRHLGVADDLAWSCYEPFLAAAKDAGTLTEGELKEPPLVFYSADRAPFAQARTKALHPPGLDSKDLEQVSEELQRLPVPVIGMPWAVANRLPEVLLVGHEAGHVIAEDMKFAAEVVAVISGIDLTRDNAGRRKDVWIAWSDEIFADIIGVLTTGTAFVSGLAAEMAGAKNEIEQARIDVDSPGRYPTPTLRIALCSEVLRTIGVTPPTAWAGTYRGIAGDSGEFKGDIAPLAAGLLDHAWTPIGDMKLNEVMGWGVKCEEDVKKVATAALNKAPAQVNFNVRVWVAAAMHAALANSKKFENLDLDKTLASFIIERRSDAVRSSTRHRLIVLTEAREMTPELQEAQLQSSDQEAGRGMADRLRLHP